ncbi:MAG: methyltransferase domain-containing protein [Promethearchaeota archaeon]
MDYREIQKFRSQLDSPFLETNPIYLKAIFKTLEKEFALKKDSKQVFIDLGAGNGQIIIFSALNYGIKSIGIEIDPILINEAKNSIKSLKKQKTYKKSLFKKIKIIHGDFYQLNLRNCDFIYIYSLPTMQIYLRHVFKTVEIGSVIISHKYMLENLAEYLDFKHKLEFDKENQKLSTFFYRRIQ